MNAFSSTSPIQNQSPFHMKHSHPTPSILKPIVFVLATMTIAKGADSDFDGLDDAVETNTGIYVSPSDTGTNPDAADSDGDGVPDGLEVKEKTSPVDATNFNSFSKGLFSYYPFSGNSLDESGNNRNGTFFGGVSTASDRFASSDSAFSFDGVTGAVVADGTTNNKVYDTFTISFWAKPNTLENLNQELTNASYDHRYVIHGPQSGSGSGIAIALGTNGVSVLEHGDGWLAPVITYSKDIGSRWVHIAVKCKDSSAPSLYVDGVLAKVGASTGRNKTASLLASSSSEGIGGGGYGRFSGLIDEVRLYSSSLTDTELLSLHKKESPRFIIIPGSFTWHQAKSDAEARGGRLAVLDTQEKINNASLIHGASNPAPSIWIGLTDDLNEGYWKWITGEKLTSSNWNAPTGEPNNGNSYGNEEDYALMESGWQSRWNDAGGYNQFGYLFENVEQSSNLTLDSSINGTITGSGEYDPGSPATLTATPNPGFRFTGWTGDASGRDNPLTITMDADKTVGATFEKDLSDTDNDGLTAYDELVTYGSNPALADTDGDGLSDGYELGVGRFSIVAGSFTWQQARDDARSKGGDLASFPTQDRWNRALQNLAGNPFEDFTGLWIGASDAAVDGTWTWVNGETFSFAPWGTSRPSSTSGNSLDFAEVSGGGGSEIGKWYDRSPTTIRDGYLLEMGYATSPTVADADGDGLNDGQEQTAGTNPTTADTDGDGLSDGQEINLTGTNPKLADTNGDGTNDAASDQDGDGLGNLAEITQHGTDPRKADTDGDGLSDGTELSHPGRYFTLIEGSFTQAQAAADASTRRGRLACFPNANDFTRAAGRARKATQGYLWFGLSDAATEGTWLWSDSSAPAYTRWLNGQPDGDDGENHAVLMENTTQWADAVADFIAAGYLFERVGLDPLASDTDGDGLSDGAESSTHQTNPVLDDSDSDGLTDGAEINTHGSNPKLADTDSDGLSDFAEVVTHATNPVVKDSDADGFDDLFEINTGFNPTLDSSTPDAISSIRTAVEFRFNAGNGLRYRIEGSTNLQNWETVETEIIGTGGVVTRFYSIENQPKRYFRVVKISGSSDPGGDGI
jgi:uncharacterized repeat protein (TIGR02543 family)